MSDAPETHETIANDPELQALIKGIEADSAAGVDVDQAAAAIEAEADGAADPAAAAATDAAPAVDGEPTAPVPEIDTSGLEGEILTLLKEAGTEREEVLGELEQLIKLASIKKGSRHALAQRLERIRDGLLRLRARARDGVEP